MTATSLLEKPKAVPSKKRHKTDLQELAISGMLAVLRIKCWGVRIADESLITEISSNHGANREHFSARKALIDPKHLAPILKPMRRAREEHRLRTAPWTSKGVGLLLNDGYFSYCEVMRQAREEIEAAIPEFIANYPKYIKEHKNELGTLFNKDDYPTSESLATKFSFDIDFLRIADPSHPVSRLNKLQADALKKSYEKSLQEYVDNAMISVIERTMEPIERLHEALDQYKVTDKGIENKFKDAVILNVGKILTVVKDLNVAGNPSFDKVLTDSGKKLLKYPAADLRADPEKRDEIRAAADDILSKMKHYYG